MRKDVIIVTAFQDIGRDDWVGTKNGQVIPSYIKRGKEVYIERFERLAKLNNKIILFCEEELFYLAEKYPNVTVHPFKPSMSYHELLSKIGDVQKRKEFIDFVVNKSSPEYWSAEYVLINAIKTAFIKEAIYYGSLQLTDTAAWIDFGYCRTDQDAPAGKTFKFDHKGKINVFSNGPLSEDSLIHKPIFDIFRTGEVLIQGSHIIGPADALVTLGNIIHIQMNKLLNIGLIDDDQTLLLMSYRHNKNDFIINENSSSDWFNIIRSHHE